MTKPEHFEIKCKKCGREAKLEARDYYSFRNDITFDYVVAICTSCKIEESIKGEND